MQRTAERKRNPLIKGGALLPLPPTELDRYPGSDSLACLHRGSSKEFISALKDEIEVHPALHHEYLKRLSNGDFRNQMAVLRDYAFQYSVYSEWFVFYLEGVLSGIDNQNHRNILLENLEEEKGTPNAENPEELPHVEIYKQFKEQVGVTETYCKSVKPSTTVLLWRDLFLQKCSAHFEGVGIAAIGLATEGIISAIYPYILAGITDHTELSDDASLFFRLHLNCDDSHSKAFEAVVEDIAEDFSTREAIRFGVFSSLNLRNAFWDSQLARSTKICCQ